MTCHVKQCSKCGANPRRKSHAYCASCWAEYQRRWNRDHPRTPAQKAKVNIRSKAAHAQSAGVLVPQPCAHCGTTECVEKHHHDYAKPLDVEWLCKRCHWDHHVAERKEKARQQFRAIVERYTKRRAA